MRESGCVDQVGLLAIARPHAQPAAAGLNNEFPVAGSKLQVAEVFLTKRSGNKEHGSLSD